MASGNSPDGRSVFVFFEIGLWKKQPAAIPMEI